MVSYAVSLFCFVFFFCGAQCQLTNIYFFCVGVTHAGDAQSFTGIEYVCLTWRRKPGGMKCFAIKHHEAGSLPTFGESAAGAAGWSVSFLKTAFYFPPDVFLMLWGFF